MECAHTHTHTHTHTNAHTHTYKHLGTGIICNNYGTQCMVCPLVLYSIEELTDSILISVPVTHLTGSLYTLM